MYAVVLYGNNLKNKLEVDVLTKSEDVMSVFSTISTTDTDKALSAAAGKELYDHIENLVTVTKLEGTTTSSGALELPTAVRNGTFICAYGSTTAYLVFRRDPNYLMVKEPITLSAIASTAVSINVVYIP